MTVTGLSSNTTYYFAMKTSDAVPNWSAISNVPSGATADGIAPAAISNLAAGSPTTTSITLTWTAPGDDGNTGTATSYDIRYSTSTINDSNWASATQVTGEPTPAVAGTNQNMFITSLSSDTTYYFAMKTSDEVPNVSALSNIASATTADGIAPAAVSNLATSNPTGTTITLTWTAPGDDGNTGTATSYNIRYSTSTINDASFASATAVTGVPAPQVAGTNQSVTVTGLTQGTTYYFAMKTSDEVPNVSALSNVASGATIASTITFINNILTYGRPSDLDSVIDPPGLNDVAVSYGVSKASFQALNPEVVAFNGAPAPTPVTQLVAYYTTTDSVSFTFGVSYNYGSYTTYSRGAFSGTVSQDAISTAPNTVGGTTDWLDATITSTGGKGVVALGFCACFRDDQAVDAGQAIFTHNDGTTGTVTLPALGYTNPRLVFIGYQAPAGKTITRVQASHTSTVGGAWVTVDDWSFVMGTPADIIPPAAVTNLATSNPTGTSVTLTWTAPGDDGNTGTATSYDIRYSTSAINDANWAGTTQVSGEPAPAVAGTNQNMTITGLASDTTYYFAIKTSDEVPNTSGLSNVPSAHTLDITAPAAVSNLAAGTPTSSSLTLTWTAPGDDGNTGTATSYDIRYSTSTITGANFAGATQVAGVPAPQAAGTNQSVTVSGLSVSTTYYFAMKTADEVPNWSALSNVASGTTSAPTPVVVALKRDVGLVAGGATDARFNNATVRTVTVADTGIYNVATSRYMNAGACGTPANAAFMLYKFDLSSIPANSTINLAQLRLYHTAGNGTQGNGDVCMVLTHSWTEGTGATDMASYPGAAGGVSFAHPNGKNTGPDQDANGGTTGSLQTWGAASNAFFDITLDAGTSLPPSSTPIGTGYHVIPVTATSSSGSAAPTRTTAGRRSGVTGTSTAARRGRTWSRCCSSITHRAAGLTRRPRQR